MLLKFLVLIVMIGASSFVARAANASARTASQTSASKYDAGLNKPFEYPSAVTGKTLNVQRYGATPDDASDDDATAFRRAIAAAVESSEIYIPDGVYHFKTRAVELKSGVGLRGQSNAKTIISALFETTADNDNSYVFRAKPGVNNLTLSNFKINRAGGASLLYPIWLGARGAAKGEVKQVHRIAVRSLVIEDFEKMAISLRNARHILVSDNTIRNATALGGGGEGYGVMIGYDDSENNRVVGNRIGPVIRHGVLIQYRAHHNLIERNTVTGSTQDAYDLHGEDEYSNELRFNTASDSGEGGFGVGNTGGSAPEHFNSGANNYIHHNEVYNSRYGVHIYRQSHDTYVEDNNFHHNKIGILIHREGANRCRIINNKSQFNDTGASIENAFDLVMNRNVITDNKNFGLKIDAASIRYQIAGNDFRRNGGRVRLGNKNGNYKNNLE